LNHSLLLLTKIENKQFTEQSAIDIKALLQSKIDQFSELWKSRDIVTQIQLSEKLVNGNSYLADILLNNLLSNATKHNFLNGSISIVLNEELCISNTGAGKPLDEKRLYKRFAEQDKTTD